MDISTSLNTDLIYPDIFHSGYILHKTPSDSFYSAAEAST